MNTIQRFLGLEPVIRSNPSKYSNPTSSLNPNSYFGIELELEDGDMDVLSSNLRKLPYQYWEITEDNSLRNGIELIFRAGYRSKWVEAALDSLPAILNETDYVPSWRCGVHVHNYIGGLTLHQLQSYLMVYLMNESSIYALSDIPRTSSNFCVPLLQISHEEIERMLLSESLDSWNYSEERRYLGFNPVPLWSKGTIEFRSFESTTDIQKLRSYVRAINAIFTIAETIPFTKIANDVLNDHAEKYAVTNKPMDENGIYLVKDLLLSNS